MGVPCVQVGVSGRRCEECVSGWFSLGPDGCSRCFCSGLSSDCEEQGGLQRVPVSTSTHVYYVYTHVSILNTQHHMCTCTRTRPLSPQISLSRSPALLSLVSQSNLQGVVSGVHQQGGDSLLDTRQLDSSRPVGPLYWRLPPHYQGPQVLLLCTLQCLLCLLCTLLCLLCTLQCLLCTLQCLLCTLQCLLCT